jgi:pimeloyl-ACP methyl ester carboxylesterase
LVIGGAVATYFVINYPERVDKLVFVDGGIFDSSQQRSPSDSPFAFLQNIDLNSPIAEETLRVSLRPATFADIMSSAYYDPAFITEEVVAGYTRPLQIENWPYGFISFLQDEQSQVVTMADLATGATMPTLIIWGEADTWIPLARGESMRGALADVRLVTYPKVGHLPMEKNIDRFNADLIRFLEE